MTNKEILDGNKLIAEFLGFEFKNGVAQNEVFYTLEKEHPIYLQGYSYKCAKFHSSWDWMMPVIDKIESLEGNNPFKDNPKVKFQGDHVEIFWYSTYRGDCIYWKNYTGIDNNTYQHKNQEDSRILAAFRAIIEFIKWYNKKNDKN